MHALARYVFEPRMGEYEVLLGIVTALVAEHGRIDFVESNGEHWLEVEGRLRNDLGIDGPTRQDVARLRSKLALAEVFEKAGVPCLPGIRCSSSEAIKGFAAEHGLPLVLKPDSGSGALSTFRVATDAELDAALLLPLDCHVVQPFIAPDNSGGPPLAVSADRGSNRRRIRFARRMTMHRHGVEEAHERRIAHIRLDQHARIGFARR